MAINSTLANQIFFASQGVPATGKENSAGQAYANEVAYAHAATYNPLEVLGGDTKEFVVKIYKTVLGRTNPLQDDPEGVVYWTNAINNGLNKAAFIDEMTAVAIKNGGSDKAAAQAANAAYVNEIYSNILGRPASQDPAGSQYWIDALNKGTIARSKVVDEINAAAAVNKDAGFQTKNTEYVTGLYKDLLGREPEAEGLKYWTDALNAGTSRAELVVSLINSANSGTGADKANLAAKTEALNSFSNNFSDYNVLPGSETYDNARAQAGAEIKGITSSTNNPTTVVTSWLNNSGYKDKYQEDTPAPQGTTLYATYNDELRGEWANASDVANAEVTFKADTAEERALIRQAKEIGVTVNAATQNVSFKNLNGAEAILEKATINSTPNSAAVVDTKGLADLPNITTIEDREGNTTLKIDTKIANLTKINMGNGNDNLNIADADQLSNNKVAVDMGQGGNDTLTLGKGDFSKAFSTIKNVDTIVQGDKTTAAHLNLSQISSNISGTSTDNIKVTADKINFDGDIKLTVDASFKVTNSNPVISGAASEIDISNIRGISANAQELTLDTVTNAGAVSAQLTKVQGNSVDARLHEVLDLGKGTFGKLATIKDIYAVSANKATLQKASALSDGFNLRGELNVTPNLATDLVNNKIDLSKIASEALVGGTSIVNVDVSNGVSGAVTEIIGSKDANLVDNVVLKGGTYDKLEKISDISVVSTENDGSFAEATLKNAKVLENGFNLKGNVKFQTKDTAAAEALKAIDLSKVTGEFTDAAGTVKSVATIDLTTNAANLTALTKVVGSKDAELKEELVLGNKDFTSGAVNKLELIQDIDTVTSKGASIHNKAIVNGFALTKDSTDLNVKVAASDAVVDLSTVTAEANNAITLDIEQVTEAGKAFVSALTSIKGSTAANIVDSYTAKATDTYASLTSISDINNLDLSALAKGSHDKLTSIEGGIANLGSGDFTALTTLTAAVRAASGDKVNTLSYDNLAGSGAFNLTLDGSDNKTAGANFVTLAATSKADATDLSAVKVAGNQGVTLAITGVNKNITLSDSKAYANIHEVINLDAAAIGNVTITGFGAGDSIKLPAGSNLQFNIGKFAEIQNNGTIGSGNVYVEMSKVPANVTYDLKNKESVINILEKQFENTGVNTKNSSATIAFNGTDGKSYIWQYLKTSAKEGIQNEDMTLISITDAKFDKNSEITDNGLYISEAGQGGGTGDFGAAFKWTSTTSTLDLAAQTFDGNDVAEQLNNQKAATVWGVNGNLTVSGAKTGIDTVNIAVIPGITSATIKSGAGTFDTNVNLYLGAQYNESTKALGHGTGTVDLANVTASSLTSGKLTAYGYADNITATQANLANIGSKLNTKADTAANNITLTGTTSGNNTDVDLTSWFTVGAEDTVTVSSVSGSSNSVNITLTDAKDIVTLASQTTTPDFKGTLGKGADVINLSADTTIKGSDIAAITTNGGSVTLSGDQIVTINATKAGLGETQKALDISKVDFAGQNSKVNVVNITQNDVIESLTLETGVDFTVHVSGDQTKLTTIANLDANDTISLSGGTTLALSAVNGKTFKIDGTAGTENLTLSTTGFAGDINLANMTKDTKGVADIKITDVTATSVTLSAKGEQAEVVALGASANNVAIKAFDATNDKINLVKFGVTAGASEAKLLTSTKVDLDTTKLAIIADTALGFNDGDTLTSSTKAALTSAFNSVSTLAEGVKVYVADKTGAGSKIYEITAHKTGDFEDATVKLLASTNEAFGTTQVDTTVL